MEIEIIQTLLEEILVHTEAINDACDVCAELDCLLSFAEASRVYDYRRPTMTVSGVMDIKKGRCVFFRFQLTFLSSLSYLILTGT